MFSSMYNIYFYNFFFSLTKTWVSIYYILHPQYKLNEGRKFWPFFTVVFLVLRTVFGILQALKKPQKLYWKNEWIYHFFFWIGINLDHAWKWINFNFNNFADMWSTLNLIECVHTHLSVCIRIQWQKKL